MSEFGRKLIKYEDAVWACAVGEMSDDEKEDIRNELIQAHVDEVLKEGKKDG